MAVSNAPSTKKRVTFAEPLSDHAPSNPSAAQHPTQRAEADDRQPAATADETSEDEHNESAHETACSQTINITRSGLREDGISGIEGTIIGLRANNGAGMHAYIACEMIEALAKEALKEVESNKRALKEEGKDMGLLDYHLNGCLAFSQASIQELGKPLKRPGEGEGEGRGWSNWECVMQ